MIHPALSAAIGLLFLFGVWRAAEVLVRRLTGGTGEPEDTFAGFFLLLALLGSALHGLTRLGWLGEGGVRVAGAGLGLWGALAVIAELRRAGAMRGRLREWWRTLSAGQRVQLVLLVVGVAAFFVLALCPPTDADSQNYHLPVPLEFLRAGRFVAHPEWLHAQLIGLGEYLILLGLILRTDVLSALIQLAGLVALLVVVWRRAETVPRRLLGATLVLAVPTLLFLVPNQKPQLAGTAALIVAAALLARRRPLTTGTLVLVGGAVMFACGLKYSFYLTGSGVFGYGLVLALRQRQAGKYLLAFVALYLVTVFPLHWTNWRTYGDPIPPVLTALLTPHRNPQADALYAQINQRLDVPWHEQIAFMMVPQTPGMITGILGLGVIAIAFVRFRDLRRQTGLVGLTLYALAVMEKFGTYQSRYYLDVYLLAVLVVAGAPELRRGASWYAGLLAAQLAAVVAMAGAGVVKLAPGLASPAARIRVMTEASEFYAIATWVDHHLPADALIVNGFHPFALYPREVLSWGMMVMAQREPARFAEIVRTRATDPDHVYLVTPFPGVAAFHRRSGTTPAFDLRPVATVTYQRGSRKLGGSGMHDTFHVFQFSFRRAGGEDRPDSRPEAISPPTQASASAHSP